MIFNWYSANHGASRNTFPFFAEATPSTRLLFSSLSTDIPMRPLHKRVRPKTDVDGEGSGTVQKKKRRLRLNLVTSRLSRPYATPATHIAGRGTPKICMWTRRRAIGQDLLRKAALMNSTKSKHVRGKGGDPRSQPALIASKIHDCMDGLIVGDDIIADRKDDHHHLPPSSITPPSQPFTTYPSPLGSTSYNAFDLDSDLYNDDEWEDTEEDESEAINSDFNNRGPAEDMLDDYDLCMPPEYDITESFPQRSSSHEELEVVKEIKDEKEGSLGQIEGRAIVTY